MFHVKQFLKVLCFTTFFMMLSGAYYSKADTLDLIENILQPTELTEFYINNLDSVQQEIASYLVGCYNSIYLGARGFNATDDTFTDSNVYFATMKMYGSKIFNFANSVASRFDNTLSQYISSVLMYARDQNYNSFQDWYNSLSSDFYIPYSSDSLNSWDRFYNDNSNDGIAVLGDVANNWVSGQLFDFGYEGLQWGDSSSSTTYNNFIINNSPVLFTNAYDFNSSGTIIKYQTIYGFGNINDIPDSIFVLRSDLSFARFGYSDLSILQNNIVVPYLVFYNPGNKVYVGWSSNANVRSGIIQDNSNVVSLHNTVYNMFKLTPFYNQSNQPNNPVVFENWYPYINHVFLVDDLNTLSNPEEVFDVDGYHISSDQDIILKPNGNYKFNVVVNMPDNNTYIKYIVINSVDDNHELVSEDDFTPNPVILNIPITDSYYKPYSPTSPLPSFDIGLFGEAGGQITYFKECAEKFIIYTRQVLDCFSFNDGEEGPALIIVAVLIIGIAGGLVVKMLL